MLDCEKWEVPHRHFEKILKLGSLIKKYGRRKQAKDAKEGLSCAQNLHSQKNILIFMKGWEKPVQLRVGRFDWVSRSNRVVPVFSGSIV